MELDAATQATSRSAPVTCSAGELGEDSRFELSISKDRKNAVVFDFHETTYALSSSHIVKNGNSIAVVGQNEKASSEGTEFSEQVDALMVYNPADRTINLTLITGGTVHFAAAELQCKLASHRKFAKDLDQLMEHTLDSLSSWRRLNQLTLSLRELLIQTQDILPSA